MGRPVCPGRGAQLLASEGRRDAGPGLDSVLHMTPEGPAASVSARHGEGAVSGPGKPTRTWPGPIWRSLIGWGGPRDWSPCLPVLPRPIGERDPAAQVQALDALRDRVTRGGQGLRVLGCSTLSRSSRDFLGVSSQDFPIFWPSRPLWPPSRRGPRSVWLSSFGFFPRPLPVHSAGAGVGVEAG